MSAVCMYKKIPLPPITLLVGRNSSGKSAFLRLFPLIKRSILRTFKEIIFALGGL